MKRKVRAWLCCDRDGEFALWLGARRWLTIANATWWHEASGSPRTSWLWYRKRTRWGQAVVRRLGYPGPLPAPGKCIRVEIEVPNG
jgi:hypothetical protein